MIFDHPKVKVRDKKLKGFDHKANELLGGGLSAPSAFLVIYDEKGFLPRGI